VSVASPAKRALVLSGGGARAAYQAGVLFAIAARMSPRSRIPFSIVCGTSAGAINAAAVAAGASRFAAATTRLRHLWSDLHVDTIYRADALHLLGNAARIVGSIVPFLQAARSVSLLDNRPLGKLLAREIPFSAVRAAIAAGDLDALTITAASYTSGMSVSFCAVADATPLWERAQRIGVRSDIGVPHLLASSAIPLVFAPVAIDGEYYGDGAVRQVAPTAPALHLGADRILVVGAARSSLRPPMASPQPPTLAQVGSHVLASIFTDALGTDLEKVRLINTAVRQIDTGRLAQSPVPLREVDLLVITPSIELESIAHEHVDELPRSLRAMLRLVGATGEGGAGLLSYLLFEPGFIRRLIELGLADAHAKGSEIDAFLSDA